MYPIPSNEPLIIGKIFYSGCNLSDFLKFLLKNCTAETVWPCNGYSKLVGNTYELYLSRKHVRFKQLEGLNKH